MKTPATPKTDPVKRTSTTSKKSPAQKSLVKTAAAYGAEKPVANSQLQVDEIAARACKIWQQQGCPEGHQLQHWCQAERDILENGSHAYTLLS